MILANELHFELIGQTNNRSYQLYSVVNHKALFRPLTKADNHVNEVRDI